MSMKINNVARLGGILAAAVGLTAAGVMAVAQAQQSPGPLKIGVMDGFSGVYGDLTAGEVEAMQMAIEEVGGKVLGRPVEILSADHQTKPDVGAAIARKWYDVDGVRKVSQEKGLIDLNTGAASSDLTGPACSPTGAHWVYDTYSLAHVTGSAMVKAGGDSWYFLTADYAFGKQLQADTTGFITAAKGTVKGASRYPFPDTSDFSSFLVQAQASGAKVLGLANAGADTVNSIKQAHEFGLNQTMKIAALLMFITDVHALGLNAASGLTLTESFYWDLNDRTRAFTKRVLPKTPNNYPNMIHAGCYSGALHYLKAAAAMGGAAAAKKDGVATINKMKSMEVDDDCFGKTKIRVDGRNLVPAYLFEVKKPAESKKPWDYYKLVATTPGDEAFRPLAEGHCPFVKA